MLIQQLKKAEEYAKNSALAHEAAEAANDLAKAKDELQEAYIEYGGAQTDYDKASTAYAEALIESQEKDATARSDELAAVGLVNAGIHSGDLPKTVGGLTAGTFLSESGNQIIKVEHKDDNTTTITVAEKSNPDKHTSRTYSSADNYESTDYAVKTIYHQQEELLPLSSKNASAYRYRSKPQNRD